MNDFQRTLAQLEAVTPPTWTDETGQRYTYHLVSDLRTLMGQPLIPLSHFPMGRVMDLCNVMGQSYRIHGEKQTSGVITFTHISNVIVGEWVPDEEADTSQEEVSFADSLSWVDRLRALLKVGG